jgi:signal transduction histidine kinase
MIPSGATTDGQVTPLRVTCMSADEPTATALAYLLATLLPGAQIDATDLSSVRSVPDADCAVLDASSNEAAALATLRTLRARGFKAPTICVVAGGSSRDSVDRARLGISHTLEAPTLAVMLPEALRQATRLDELALTHPALAQTLRTLRQTQRMLAAGEIALKLQHSLNNPLAALLAEAQLLELEELVPDHRRSIERIIELSRRLIEVTRTLEGIGGAR